MKKNFFLICIFLLELQINYAQTQVCPKEEAEKCYTKGEWLNGVKYTPHSSINKVEFMAQYHKNKNLWDKAFIFLRETNLDTIRPGKYSIAGDSLFASVTENPTKNFENAKWEYHKKYIDLQMVIKGIEKMGITPLNERVKMIEPFNDKKDVGFVTCTEGQYYTAEAGTFFIFLPSDAHCPSIKVEGCDKDKKIVLKMKVD